MNTFSELFDELDGPANVGRIIGVSTEHAAIMRRRNSIPAKYWDRLVHGSRAVSYDLLASLAAKRSHKNEAA